MIHMYKELSTHEFPVFFEVYSDVHIQVLLTHTVFLSINEQSLLE